MKYDQNFCDLQLPFFPNESSFVYHLIDDDERILYIGQTKNILLRIGTHLREGTIPFKKCKFLVCDPSKALYIEKKQDTGLS